MGGERGRERDKEVWRERGREKGRYGGGERESTWPVRKRLNERQIESSQLQARVRQVDHKCC